MIRSVIVEDEKKSSELLSTMIKRFCPDVAVEAIAESVKEGEEVIRKITPDLVFLDVEMGDGNGFDLLKKLNDVHFDLIFTTASDQHAVKAIKYSAIDYLLKPIDPEELQNAVGKVKERRNDNSAIDNLKFLLKNLKRDDDRFSRITLPTGAGYELVNIKDIIRCEAEGNYTNFFIEGKKKLLVSASLKHYEDLLPAEDFIRVHHHHLININHVVRFLKTDGGYAVMTDGTEVEVSRRKKDAFMQRLQNN
jgi:two-component system, LytTR family, response regulator